VSSAQAGRSALPDSGHGDGGEGVADEGKAVTRGGCWQGERTGAASARRLRWTHP